MVYSSATNSSIYRLVQILICHFYLDKWRENHLFYDVSDFQRSVSKSFIKNGRRSWDSVLRAFPQILNSSLTGGNLNFSAKIMVWLWPGFKGHFPPAELIEVPFCSSWYLGTLSCGTLHKRFLMCSICVSCHWGSNCHLKTLRHGPCQTVADNSQSLDAAEEGPLRQGQRRTLCCLLRIQGGTQMSLGLRK